MLRITGFQRRQVVARFSIKNFHARQKIPLTPENISSVFEEKLDVQDRLLRQSSVGAGAKRFLVLDKNQCVKGVYHPLLCLPYPIDGAGVLGLPVSTYIERIKEKLAESEKSSTSLVIVSHANGLGITTFAVDGSMRLPLANVKLPAQRKTGKRGLANSRDMRPFPRTTSLTDDLAEVISENYAEFIHPCSSFFFLANENAVLTFNDIKRAWKEKGYMETSPMSLEDKRWVQLQDLVVVIDRNDSLYCQDDKDEAVVNEKGLTVGVKRGLLELGA